MPREQPLIPLLVTAAEFTKPYTGKKQTKKKYKHADYI